MDEILFYHDNNDSNCIFTRQNAAEMHKLIFATHNKHKLHEVRHLLENTFQVIDLDDVQITEDIQETAPTLEGNAQLKARYVFEKTGCHVFADDTGLEVEALNGAPGVISARYAGPDCNAADNLKKLMLAMQNQAHRKARFRTVICLIYQGNEYLFEGIVNGTIATQTAGGHGFGYDPVFVPDGYHQTFAQMPLELKNTISHRAKAMQKLIAFLNSVKR